MAGEPRIVELPCGTEVLYGVICDDHKLECFQQAACLMQEALELQCEDASGAVERKDGQLDEKTVWPTEFLDALSAIDAKDGDPWRLFSVATVKCGSHSGMRAVGIGSNQSRLKRASNLALAFTVARTTLHTSASLQALGATRINVQVGVALTKKLAATATVTAGMADAPNQAIVTAGMADAPVEAFHAWLNADTPVDCAKQRLVQYRLCQPWLSRNAEFIVNVLLDGNLELASDWPDGLAPHVIPDLRTVLELDTWNGSPCGKQWVQDWQKWEAPFTDQSNYHYGKKSKASVNYHWYFGCDPSPIMDVPTNARSIRTSPPQPPPAKAKVAPPPPPKAKAAPPPPAKAKAKPPPPRPLPPQQAKEPASSVPHKFAEDTKHQQAAPPVSLACVVPSSTLLPRGPPACAVPSCAFQTDPVPSQGSSPHPTDFDELHHNRVVEGLNNANSCESLTIGTLTSVDTIPLGTDLDPQNHYNNLWASNQICDPNGKLLVQYNLCCRVIDAENLGYSFGREVCGQEKCYNAEGVKRAVAHFLKGGIDVIVVSKRQDTAQCGFGEGVQVVIAERTDDIMVLKQAHSRNCPIVSRDGFEKWKKDLRVSKELRQWLSESADLQVRFSWGSGGVFVPDFDLPRPVVRPGSRGPLCKQCDQPCTDSVQIGQHKSKQWYCNECWKQWMAKRNEAQ